MPLFGTVDWIMKNILFAASECVPFIKTGGLADVVGALPKSLDRSEYDVRVIIPNYTCIPWEYRSQFRYVSHFYMDYGRHVENVHVGIMEYVYEGVHFYFIDNEYYFKCDRPYSDSTQWDIERFILLKGCPGGNAGDRIPSGHHSLPRLADRHDPRIPQKHLCDPQLLLGNQEHHDHPQSEIPGRVGHPSLCL